MRAATDLSRAPNAATVIARGSAAFVFAPLSGMVAVGVAALVFENMRITLWSVPLFLVFLFALVFFRDPERRPGDGIVSVADGRVLEADHERRKVVVFLGLRNVHVNRAPLDGRVSHMEYERGGHAPAYSPRAVDNERLETLLDTALGPVRVLQVAGILARRIVPYVIEGDRVKKGQRIGMIRFGSRVELTLPEGTRLVVGRGEKVRAGETTVAVVDDVVAA